MNQYHIYIMRNRSNTFHIGVTNNLVRRIIEYRRKLAKGSKYEPPTARLVYFETTKDMKVASAREKQLKSWIRKKKVALVESVNPNWCDLSADWIG